MWPWLTEPTDQQLFAWQSSEFEESMNAAPPSTVNLAIPTDELMLLLKLLNRSVDGLRNDPDLTPDDLGTFYDFKADLASLALNYG